MRGEWPLTVPLDKTRTTPNGNAKRRDMVAIDILSESISKGFCILIAIFGSWKEHLERTRIKESEIDRRGGNDEIPKRKALGRRQALWGSSVENRQRVIVRLGSLLSFSDEAVKQVHAL